MNNTGKPTSQQKSERQIALSTLVDYQIYSALVERESNPISKELVSELAQLTKDSFNFWGRKANVRGDEASRPLFVCVVLLLRHVVGVQRTVRYIVNREKNKISQYELYCAGCLDGAEIKAVNTLIERSLAIISQFKEVGGRI